MLPEIKKSLDLDNKEIWTSNIVGVAGTILMRFILGPGCDKYGARVLFTAVLCFASIPTALTGVVQTAVGLSVLRLFIGVAGGTFVMCQYWSSRMFTSKYPQMPKSSFLESRAFAVMSEAELPIRVFFYYSTFSLSIFQRKSLELPMLLLVDGGTLVAELHNL